MSINIPPSLWGEAQIYSDPSPPKEITLTTVDSTNVILAEIDYGIIYGLPRSAFFDLIIKGRKNTSAAENYLGTSCIYEIYQPNGETPGWTQFTGTVLAGKLLTPASVETTSEYVLYGGTNCINFLDIANGGTFRIRWATANSDSNSLILKDVIGRLRISNIVTPF